MATLKDPIGMLRFRLTEFPVLDNGLPSMEPLALAADRHCRVLSGSSDRGLIYVLTLQLPV